MARGLDTEKLSSRGVKRRSRVAKNEQLLSLGAGDELYRFSLFCQDSLALQNAYSKQAREAGLSEVEVWKKQNVTMKVESLLALGAGLGSSPAERFAALYALLLARDLIKNDPLLAASLKDCLKGYQEKKSVNLEDTFAVLLTSEISRKDAIEQGRQNGLMIEADEREDNFSEAFSVDGQAFAFLPLGARDEGMRIFSAEKGLGSSRWQKMSAIEMLALSENLVLAERGIEKEGIGSIVDSLENLPDSLLNSESQGRVKRTADLVSACLAPGGAERVFRLSRIIADDKVSLTKKCQARMELAEQVALWADLSEEIAFLQEDLKKASALQKEGTRAKEDLGDVSDALMSVQSALEDSLGQDIKEALGEAKKSAEKHLGPDFVREGYPPSAYIHWKNFSDAITDLERSKSINGAAMWDYLSQVFDSQDSTDWRRAPRSAKEGLGPDFKPMEARLFAGETIAKVSAENTKLIYGSLLVQRDPLLAKKLETSYQEEEELRLSARLLGKVPNQPIIYMPSSDWVFTNDVSWSQMSGGGLNYPFREGQPSFVFLANPFISEQDRRGSVVHELIHAGQPTGERAFTKEQMAGIPEKQFSKLSLSLLEGTTEALALLRTDRAIAEKTTSQSLIEIQKERKLNISYREEVMVLFDLFDLAGVRQEDRERTLEEMNFMKEPERLEALSHLLEKAGFKREAAIIYWQRALGDMSQKIKDSLSS